MAVVCVYKVATLLEFVRLRGLSNLDLLLRLLDRELVGCSWRGGDLGFNVPVCILWAFGRLLEISIVRFRFQGDIPAMTVVFILLILDIVTILFVTMIHLSFFWTLPLRIIAKIQSTSFKSSFFVLDSLILLGGKVPPFLLVLMFLMLSHIKRLIILSGQLLLSPQFISDCLVDSRSTASPLDVSGIETPHIALLICYSILVWIFLWTGQHPLVFYF